MFLGTLVFDVDGISAATEPDDYRLAIDTVFLEFGLDYAVNPGAFDRRIRYFVAR